MDSHLQPNHSSAAILVRPETNSSPPSPRHGNKESGGKVLGRCSEEQVLVKDSIDSDIPSSKATSQSILFSISLPSSPTKVSGNSKFPKSIDELCMELKMLKDKVVELGKSKSDVKGSSRLESKASLIAFLEESPAAAKTCSAKCSGGTTLTHSYNTSAQSGKSASHKSDALMKISAVNEGTLNANAAFNEVQLMQTHPKLHPFLKVHDKKLSPTSGDEYLAESD